MREWRRWCLYLSLAVLGGIQFNAIRNERLATNAAIESQEKVLKRYLAEQDLAEREQLRAGRLWKGELHSSSDDLFETVEHDPSGLRDQRRIAGRLPLADSHPNVRAEFELHECEPGTRSCKTGGSIVIWRGAREVCRIAVHLLATGGQLSQYQVFWPVDRAFAVEDQKMLRDLSGNGLPPDQEQFRHLIREAYAHDSLTSGVSSSSVKAAVVRAILRAICADQAKQTSQQHVES